MRHAMPMVPALSVSAYETSSFASSSDDGGGARSSRDSPGTGSTVKLVRWASPRGLAIDQPIFWWEVPVGQIHVQVPRHRMQMAPMPAWAPSSGCPRSRSLLLLLVLLALLVFYPARRRHLYVTAESAADPLASQLPGCLRRLRQPNDGEPPWLAVFGDSLSRGIFFDTVEALNGSAAASVDQVRAHDLTTHSHPHHGVTDVQAYPRARSRSVHTGAPRPHSQLLARLHGL